VSLPANYRPLPAVKDATSEARQGLKATALPGLVMDDAQAKASGKWTAGTGLPDYFATGYRYRSGNETGGLRYEFKVPSAGTYEVRINFAPHENRATKAPVSVESAGAKKTVLVNQRVAAPDKGFLSLGTFRFEPGKPAAVVIGDGPADGNVHADIVQLLPAK
jgi:hypothetical protein